MTEFLAAKPTVKADAAAAPLDDDATGVSFTSPWPRQRGVPTQRRGAGEEKPKHENPIFQQS